MWAPQAVPYVSTMGILMYVMLSTRPDICFAIEMVSRYQANSSMEHQMKVKHILKYLQKKRDYMLVYQSDDLLHLEYTDLDFQTSNRDSCKFTSSFLFTLIGEVISWRSMRQSSITNSTIEAKYVVTSKATKETVWIWKFLMGLRVVPLVALPLVLFCDNSEAVAQSKKPKHHQKSRHIKQKYHLIHEIVMKGDAAMENITSMENLTNPLTKILSTRVFYCYKDSLSVKCVPNMI